MTDLTPAIIGLGGVIVGGLIQVFFQWRMARGVRAREIREQVGDFAAAVSNYLNALDGATEYMARQLSEGRDQERVSTESEKVAKHRHGLLTQGTRLVTVDDWRISDEVARLVGMVSGLTDLMQGLFTLPSAAHRHNFLTNRQAISHEYNALLAMVAPRKIDGYLRFRSVSAGRKYLDASARRRGE